MKNKKNLIILVVIISLIVLGVCIYIIISQLNKTNTKKLTKEESIELLKGTYEDRNYVFEFKEENNNYYVYEVKNSNFKREEYWVKKDGSDIEQHVAIEENISR